ncbi:tail fiber assembly protein, partial [Escherichia coli]|nr:tail fiber assembly protein [Escherichia coli]
MTQYYYSASENAFFPAVLEEQYKKAGTFPDDAREIDDDVAVTFIGNPPDGKIRIAGSDG